MFFRKSAATVEWLVVGLGNPGRQYEHTRHNAGAMALAALAERCGVSVTRSKYHALCADAEVRGHRVLLMLPQTYMNNSGDAVAEAARFYKIPPERVLVFSDDISLPVGKVRVRRKGSDGGQKGLRSISNHLGDEFPRVKLGVGAKPRPDYDLAAWVLSNFTDDERELIASAAKAAAEAAEYVIDGKIDEAMNRFSK